MKADIKHLGTKIMVQFGSFDSEGNLMQVFPCEFTLQALTGPAFESALAESLKAKTMLIDQLSAEPVTEA